MTDYLDSKSTRYLPNLRPLPDLAGQAAAELLSGPAPSPLSAQAMSPTQSQSGTAGTLALLSQLGALKGKGSTGSGNQKKKDRTSHGSGKGAKGLPNKVSNSPGQNKRLAKSVINKKYPKWDKQDFRDLVKLWSRESGWDAKAENQTSSASGIPQMMLSVHNVPKGYQHDPLVQIITGLKYIAGRYNDPEGAWRHSQATGWY